MKQNFVAAALMLLMTACTTTGNGAHSNQTPAGTYGNDLGQSCRVSGESSRMYEVTPTIVSVGSINDDDLAKLDAKRLDGCASIEFQIDGDGRPVNIRLLKENPKGYGIGTNTIAQIKATRFEEPKTRGEWYFKNRVIITSDR